MKTDYCTFRLRSFEIDIFREKKEVSIKYKNIIEFAGSFLWL